MTSRKKFIRWYVRPFNRLKRIRDGDGAYVALSMGFSLCERYYRIKSRTITKHWKTHPFLEAAARDFDCDPHLFQAFWDVFRNGIQHQGAPKKTYTAHWLPQKPKPKIRLEWAMGGSLSYKPIYIYTDKVKRVGVDPWKFTRFVLTKFLQNPHLLERSVSHRFGSDLPQPQSPPKFVQISFDGKKH
ncbi:MAG: hypothetical protein ACYC67_05920 [Prosthecobacter sp.]